MNLLTDIALETDLPLKMVKSIFELIEQKTLDSLRNSDEPFPFFGLILSAKNYGQFERRKRNGEPNVIPAQRRIKVIVSDELNDSIQNNEVKVVLPVETTSTTSSTTPSASLIPARGGEAIPAPPASQISVPTVLPPTLPPAPPILPSPDRDRSQNNWYMQKDGVTTPSIESELISKGCMPDTLVWSEKTGWHKAGELKELAYLFGG